MSEKSIHHRLQRLAAKVGRHLSATQRRLVAAESCTGGWIAKAMTDIPGSSDWFEEGFVTYSNPAKIRALQVDMHTLKRHGAVSEQVVREMARGALEASGAEVAVAVSGVAGPAGGTPEKPVGLVWFCWAIRRGRTLRLHTFKQRFRGDRQSVRARAVWVALDRLLEL